MNTQRPERYDAEILRNGRWAGTVRRYHAWPMLQAQSVGEHSWQMYRIYCTIWGVPSAAVAEHIMKHDAGEVGTGDMPLYAKRDDPVLKERMDAAELRQQQLSNLAPVTETTDQENWRVKMCDLLEGLEHCCADYMMGNRLALPAVQNYTEALNRKIGQWTELDWYAAEDAGLVRAYMDRIRRFNNFAEHMTASER